MRSAQLSPRSCALNRGDMRHRIQRSPVPIALFFLALAQIILGGAHVRARRRAVGIEVCLGRGDHAAVLAHLEHLEPLAPSPGHPVLAFELGDDALDRALRRRTACRSGCSGTAPPP